MSTTFLILIVLISSWSLSDCSKLVHFGAGVKIPTQRNSSLFEGDKKGLTTVTYTVSNILPYNLFNFDLPYLP